MGETTHDWEDKYDPEDELSERLRTIVAADGGVELHVKGKKGTVEVVGEAHDLREDSHGNIRVRAGGTEFSWNYEIVVPSEGDPRLERVDPDQDVEAYYDSRRTHLQNIDVRLYGVDADRFKQEGAA